MYLLKAGLYYQRHSNHSLALFATPCARCVGDFENKLGRTGRAVFQPLQSALDAFQTTRALLLRLPSEPAFFEPLGVGLFHCQPKTMDNAHPVGKAESFHRLPNHAFPNYISLSSTS